MYWLVLILASLCVNVFSSPQTKPASFERTIKLNVLVLDSSNRPTIDLKQEDFRILEDGVVQSMSYFSADELPLDYCIVADTSGSVKKSINQIIDAAQTIVRTNKPSDETSLIEFKEQPELLVEFTAIRFLGDWSFCEEAREGKLQ